MNGLTITLRQALGERLSLNLPALRAGLMEIACIDDIQDHALL